VTKNADGAAASQEMTAEDRGWLKENPRPRIRDLEYDWRLNGLARIIHESSGLGLETRARAW
jgi:hypothetical protein